MGEAAPVSTRELTLNAGFEELYVDAWPRLYRYVWLFVRNHEDAEDVAAEAVRRVLVPGSVAAALAEIPWPGSS